MPEHLAEEISYLTSSVAVWGPPQCGKSMLIHNFIYSFDLLYRDPDFCHEIKRFDGETGELINYQESEQFRSVGWSYWAISRFPKGNALGEATVSAHCHYLLVHDLPGEYAFPMNPVSETIYSQSDLLLIILNLNLLYEVISEPKKNDIFTDDPDIAAILEKYAPEVAEEQLLLLPTPESYLDEAEYLYHLLCDKVKLDRKIAICLIDEGQEKGTAKSQMKRAVSMKLETLLMKFQEQFKSDVKIFNLVTSLDATKPFFWFFDEMKIKKILQTHGLHKRLFEKMNFGLYKAYYNSGKGEQRNGTT